MQISLALFGRGFFVFNFAMEFFSNLRTGISAIGKGMNLIHTPWRYLGFNLINRFSMERWQYNYKTTKLAPPVVVSPPLACLHFPTQIDSLTTQTRQVQQRDSTGS